MSALQSLHQSSDVKTSANTVIGKLVSVQEKFKINKCIYDLKLYVHRKKWLFKLPMLDFIDSIKMLVYVTVDK